LTAKQISASDKSSPEGSRFSMESLAMRNRLQVSFWGVHVNADGIAAIAAALLIVIIIAVLAASRF
jgi:hypothetical protein